MKKLFIFDFDGTLFDSVDDVIACLSHTLKVHGFPALTRSEYLMCLGGNINEIMSLVLGKNSTPENVEMIKKTYGECYAKSDKSNTRPFEGIMEVLLSLQKKDVLLAINSNRSTDSIRYFADRYLSDIDFVLIEGHNENYPSKPSPIGVNKILDRAGVLPEEAIYIGDSKTDILTAKNSEIDCAIVKWGYGDESDLQDDYPVAVVENVSDLIGLV